MGPQTSQYTNSNFSNFRVEFFWNDTLCCFPNKQYSQGFDDLCLVRGMRDCLAKSYNPFSLICASRLCHKSGEVSSSTVFSCPPHTFTCVLYKEQHNLPRATTNNPLVSFQFPLLIKWTDIRFRRKCGMCRTSFNVNVHLILVCMQMSPIPVI